MEYNCNRGIFEEIMDELFKRLSNDKIFDEISLSSLKELLFSDNVKEDDIIKILKDVEDENSRA